MKRKACKHMRRDESYNFATELIGDFPCNRMLNLTTLYSLQMSLKQFIELVQQSLFLHFAQVFLENSIKTNIYI